MTIKWVPDLGAPIVVAAVDLTLDAVAPQYAKWATGIMAVGGFVGGHFMRSSTSEQFVKNIGIASLPTFAKNIYEYAKGATSKTSGKVAFTRMARKVVTPITRTYEPEFKKAGVL